MGRDLTLPSVRLQAAAELAAVCLFDGENGRDLTAVDVGCDHAKLAIYLVQSGICKKVLACDINDGPVEKARENVARRKMRNMPLSDYITVKQNDGLKGLFNVETDRVFILGMGGELIADILESAGFVKDASRKTAYVLQAMTSEYDLRKYLYKSGFDIVKEQLVCDKGRIYSLILCIFDGVAREKSEAVLTLGEYNIANRNELFDTYIDRKIRIQTKLVSDIEKAKLDSDEPKKLLDELVKIKDVK